MSYQVLARKWRPRIFSELVGQDHVVRALSNALDNDRLHHAYLFTGTRGVGKTTLARIFAKSLNCEHGVGSTPCGQCATCREIDAGSYVDLLEVDAASRTKVDQTRELLDNVPYAPTRGRYKVYLIDEVHMFSDSSFNALLKTLEEPPPHVKFLLATTDPQKVPVTVLSRCLQFNLKRLPIDQISGYLEEVLEREGIDYDRQAVILIARAADGSMRDALSLMDQAIAFGGGEVREADIGAMLGTIAADRIHLLVESLADQNAPGLLARIREIAEMAPDFAGVLQELLSLLHQIALEQMVPGCTGDAEGQAEVVRRLAERLTPEECQLYYQIGLIGQRDLPLAPDPQSGFEMVMLRMLAFRPDDGTSRSASATPGATQKPARPATNAVRHEQGGTPPASHPQTVAEPVVSKPQQASQDIDFSRWEEVVEAMEINALAKQLANNCTYRQWDGTTLILALAPTLAHLKIEKSLERLQQAIETLLGRKVKLDIQVAESDGVTPAQMEMRQRAQRVQQAQQAIAEDPVVKALEEQLDARLIAESVKPLDN